MSDEDKNVVPIKPLVGKDGSRRKSPGFNSKGTKIGNGAGRGGDASGMPATGGWGGPARPTVDVRTLHSERDPETGRWVASPENEKAREVLKENLFLIATDPDQGGGVRVMASVAALDRLEGKPVQRTITASADDLARLTDDELRAELERFGRTAS